MKFAWLEKMAQEGQVRPEALEKIYEECGQTLEKYAGWEDLGPGGQLAMQILLGGAGMTAVGMGIGAGAEALHEHFQDAKSKAMTDVNRTKIITDHSIPTEDKEKAKARFNEILKYAPGLGPNQAVMHKLVTTKYRTGLTNQDVQNLINIQVKMTPNSMDYAAASSKHASAKITVQQVCGEKLAEAYIRLEKTASAKEYMWDLLKTLSVPVGAAVGIGAIGGIASGIGGIALRGKIEKSKEQLFSGPKDSVIGENRLKAEQAFSTLANFAPHIAADPHTARAFVTKIVSYSPDKDSPLGIQTSDLRELTDIEKNMGGGKGFFENMNAALGTSGFGKAVGSGAPIPANWDLRKSDAHYNKPYF